MKELEEALLDGRAHIAVHSAKDLPGELPAGLAVLAVPAREDARDVLVGPEGGLGALPAGAGGGPPAPPAPAPQLRGARPEAPTAPPPGTAAPRLDKLAAGAADALILAAAGLRRLGLEPAGATPLSVDVSTPAPGQGLLALQGRTGDAETAAAVAVLDDPVAHACLRAERALLAALGGGCLQPVGAYCAPHGTGLRITAFAGSDDGERAERVVVDGRHADPEALGREAAAALAAVRS